MSRVWESSNRSRAWVLASVVMVVVLVGVTAAAGYEASLAGSDFEIDYDANLVVDGGEPSVDWALVDADVRADPFVGADDDSFGQGTKEDTEVPTVVDGSIPPNKSDLREFGIWTEDSASGKFVHMFWTRVQDPSGTTNMDFEFNREACSEGNPAGCSANGVTPVRSAGDLLIVYELSKGGTSPELFLLRWLTTGDDQSDDWLAIQHGSPGEDCDASNSYPCWGLRVDLGTAGAAAGSINSSPITDAEVGDGTDLGDLDPRTFGEASIDLDFIFDDTKCESFGSVYLKSRSSDSFTAAVKDFIAPQETVLSNCGSITIEKETVPDGASGSFDFNHDIVTDPPTAIPSPFTLEDDGAKSFVNVISGTYVVSEQATPGFDLTDISCTGGTVLYGDGTTFPNSTHQPGDSAVSITVAVGDTVECTFTNSRLPTLTVVKYLNPTDDPGLFTLTIDDGDGVDVDDNNEGNGYGNAGSTDPYTLATGTYTVGELGFGGTDLAEYDTVIGGDCAADGSVTLAYGDTKTCTITNNRLPQIKLVKALLNSTSGTFDLKIGDTVFDNAGAGYGDGGTTGFQNVAVGEYTVAELGHGTTSLDDFSSSVLCDYNGATAKLGTSDTFTVGYGDTITCTFTNTELHKVIVLVCHEASDSLVATETTLGGVTVTTVDAGDLTGDLQGLEGALCGLPGFGGLGHGVHQPSVNVNVSHHTPL